MESAPTFFVGTERSTFFPVACVGATIGRPSTYRRNALECGMNGFLSKPIVIADLVQEMRKVL